MSLFGWSYPAGCSGPPDDDVPECCPMCDKPNCDDDGEPVCAAAPDFCSTACERAYIELTAKQDEQEHAAWEQEQRAITKGRCDD